MTVGTFYFFLFLVIGGGIWAFLMRIRRGDPGKSFSRVREEKREGIQPVVKRDFIGVPVVSKDGKVVRLDEADGNSSAETSAAASGKDEDSAE